MGSQICAFVDAPVVPKQVLSEVPGWFQAWERCLSRFEPGSELNALNCSGESLAPSDTLWDVLDAALVAASATDGRVTPTVLPSLEAAGYRDSFELTRAAPGPRPGGAPSLGDYRQIERDDSLRRVRLPPGVRLDFGGTAKGWAADRAAALLARLGPAQVNAGGDIALSGPRASGGPWEIAVESPLVAGEMLGVLSVRRGGVATSGRNFRKWKRDGVWQHHLIDPRTGEPAVTDVLSATVVGPSALSAEVAAKQVLLLGSVEGLAWIEAQAALSALVVLEDGTVIESRRLGATT